jgi:arylsulfatase A-like enzyme
MDRLDELGIADNTIVVFTSDNGTAGGKGSVYSIGSHMPLMIYQQGTTEGLPDVDRTVSAVDIPATILDVAEVEPPRRMRLDGRSLAPALRGEALEEQPALVEAANTRAIIHDGFKYVAFRRPSEVLMPPPPGHEHETIHTHYKGVANEYRPMISGAIHQHPAYAAADQLYDLTADPGEKNNLAQHSDHAERLASMKQMLADELRALPGTFGEFKLDVAIDGNALRYGPVALDGDLDLSAPFDILDIADRSNPTAEAYTIITYTGDRIGEFDDVEPLDDDGYDVDYSQPGEVRLVRR